MIRFITSFMILFGFLTQTGLGQTTPACAGKILIGQSDPTCNINVNDPNYSFTQNWQNEKNAVVSLGWYDPNTGHYEAFSGVLINNTSEDKTPYILTAAHTIWKQTQADNLMVFFNHELDQNGAFSPDGMFMIGANLIATSSEYDFSLLQLKHTPPLSANPYFAGWDKSTNTPNTAAVIHHPRQDLKKISIEYSSITTGAFLRIPTPPSYSTYWKFDYWKINGFDFGGIQPSSSGSPMFDGNKNIVGITAGINTPYCSPDGQKYYATKFSKAWNSGIFNTEKLKPWLDPAPGTNQQQLNGRYFDCPNNGYDGFEPNESKNTAARTFPTLGYSGWTCTRYAPISVVGEFDYYRLDATAKGVITVDLTNLPADYKIRLIKGNSIAATSDSVLTISEHLTYHYTDNGNQDFYVEVTGKGNVSCTDYHLTINWAPDPCPSVNSPTALSPGSTTASGPVQSTLYPLLSWNAATGVNSYRILVEKKVGANYIPVIDQCGGGTTFQVYPGSLDWGEEYRWQVMGLKNDCESCQSTASILYFQTPTQPVPYCSDTTFISSPQGVISDGSGTNDYQDLLYCAWKISVPGALSIKLNFSEFQLGNGDDYLVVYDGPNEQSTPLGVFYKDKPVPYEISSTGPEMFVRFISDAGYADAGWTATYQAIFPEITAYTYWFDSDVSNQNLVTLSSANSYTININVPTNIPLGKHTIHLRTRDHLGIWSPVISGEFYKNAPLSDIQVSFSKNFNNSTTLVSGPGQALSYNAPTSNGSSKGEKEVFLRVKGEGGIWSPVLSRTFYKRDSLAKLQYWFDDINGPDSQISINNDPSFTLDSLMSFGLSAGHHEMYMQIRGGTGVSSPVLSRSFFRKDSLASIKYWIDQINGPQNTISANLQTTFLLDSNMNLPVSGGEHEIFVQASGIGRAGSPVISKTFHKGNQLESMELWIDNFNSDTTLNLNSALDSSLQLNWNMAALTGKNHEIRIRTKGTDGRYSPVISREITHLGEENLMKGYRVWFDSLSASQSIVSINPGIKKTGLLSGIDVNSLSMGQHIIYLQLLDSAGRNSQVIADTFQKVIFPGADFSTLDTAICLGEWVSFSNTSINADAYLWNFGDGTVSTGANPNHYYQSAGMYNVTLVAYLTSSGLSDTLIREQYIIVSKPMLSSNISNPGICHGDSTLLTVNGANSYQWSPSAGLSHSDSSSTFAFPSITTAYQIIGADSLNCYDTMGIIVNVYPVPPKPVIGANSFEFCSGGSATIGTAPGYMAYLWSNGETGDSITVSQSLSVSVQVQNSDGCWSPVSDTVEMTERPVVTSPSIVIDGDTTFCDGETTVLYAIGGTGNYLWSDGSQNDSLIVSQSGQYAARSVDLLGCESDWATAVNIQVIPQPSLPVITQTGDTLWASSSPANSYQWYRNDSLLATTTIPYYIPTQSGSYQVVALNGGCLSDISNGYNFFPTGITGNFEKAGFSVYPNPNHGQFVFEGNMSGNEELGLSLIDARGRKIRLDKISPSQGLFRYKIDVRNLSSGVYMFLIERGSERFGKRVVISD
ncbi:MAG: PKD domain-containing protein [Bacteroidetes bacterium]|nr:PKD domain-containing protein [Bacteroidota bacterium]